jgi:hypothetical protein
MIKTLIKNSTDYLFSTIQNSTSSYSKMKNSTHVNTLKKIYSILIFDFSLRD